MKIFKSLILLIISNFAYSQTFNFPQEKINKFITPHNSPKPIQNLPKFENVQKSESGIFKALLYFNNLKNNVISTKDRKFYKKSNDTLVIGETPGDTVRINGTWNHKGPIFVLNDGVLIFKNAIVHDTGDIYVFGSGKMFADSTLFYFPQKYFYERGLLVVQNAKAFITNCSFDYSGMSHTLFLAHNAELDMKNVKFRDWTTCGMFESPKLTIDGCNLAGEYILSDKCSATFLNTDTIILWHQIPDKAEVDFEFPNGNLVNNYKFNKNVSGIKGVEYSVVADSCTVVMWALMPVNGSKVKISNSKLRLIGNWFMRGDSAFLYEIYNNSHYPDYNLPLSDRQLRLVNTDVQTWSMYVFDSSKIIIYDCILGEVGSQNKSGIYASNYLCDGSGGYFWATDTSVIFADNVTVYTTVRSERNALIILANSWLPFLPPFAVHNSILISSQNKLSFQPVPHDRSVAWLLYIDFPDSVINDKSYFVKGSAWIKQGPEGHPMKFDSYSLSYKKENDSKWKSIISRSYNQANDTNLGLWDIKNLAPGKYILKLTVKDNFGDTVDAYKTVLIKPDLTNSNKILKSLGVKIYPNPANDKIVLMFDNKYKNMQISLLNSYGQRVRIYENVNSENLIINCDNLSSGVYFINVTNSVNINKTFKIIVN
ncbi:MAG: T9SS type A sorting domain-containing protein [Bacteroidetes bacterium]|nr:T9SS type A sorting domain-containing protein [Bacteroidota bacterium]